MGLLSPDGTETADEGPAEPGFPAHERFLSRGLLIFENLTGLGAFSDRRNEFHGYPIPLASDERPVGVDAAPIGAFAVT